MCTYLVVFSHLNFKLMLGSCLFHYSHLTDDEIEAQGGQATCQSHTVGNWPRGIHMGASLHSPPSQPPSYGGPFSEIWEHDGFL